MQSIGIIEKETSGFEPGIQLFGKQFPIKPILTGIRLQEKEIIEKISDEKFELPEFINNNYQNLLEISKEKHKSNSKWAFNYTVLRPKDINFNFKERKLEFIYQSTSFFDYLASDCSLDVLLNEEDTIRDKILPVLPSIRYSPLANPIAVNILLKTSDDRYLLQRKGSFFSKTLSPSSGGLLTKPHIFDFVRREIKDQFLVSPNNIKLIGVSRDLTKGGALLLSFVGITAMTVRELARMTPISTLSGYFDSTLVFNPDAGWHYILEKGVDIGLADLVYHILSQE